jgi:hypothetical protein
MYKRGILDTSRFVYHADPQTGQINRVPIDSRPEAEVAIWNPLFTGGTSSDSMRPYYTDWYLFKDQSRFAAMRKQTLHAYDGLRHDMAEKYGFKDADEYDTAMYSSWVPLPLSDYHFRLQYLYPYLYRAQLEGKLKAPPAISAKEHEQMLKSQQKRDFELKMKTNLLKMNY